MRRFAAVVLLLAVSVTTTHTQDALTRDQRIDDLTQLASFYAKNYAPYEWKIRTQDFDLLRLTPWLQRIRHADDLRVPRAAHRVRRLAERCARPHRVPHDVQRVAPDDRRHLRREGAHRGAEPHGLPAAPSVETSSYRLTAVRSARSSRPSGSMRSPRISGAPIASPPAASSAAASRSCRTSPISETRRRSSIRLAATGSDHLLRRPVGQGRHPGHLARAGAEPSRRQRAPHDWSQPSKPSRRGRPAPGREAFSSLRTLGPSDNTLPSYMEPIRALLNASVSKDYFSVTGIGGRFPIYAPPPGFVQRPVPPG